jgi:hypothetical protein
MPPVPAQFRSRASVIGWTVQGEAQTAEPVGASISRAQLIALGLIVPADPGAPTRLRSVDGPTLHLLPGEREMFEAAAKSGACVSDARLFRATHAHDWLDGPKMIGEGRATR